MSETDPEECDHDIDAEYLYPSDAEVLSIESDAEDVRIVLAVPCPDCDAALELAATVDAVTESALSLPLDDAEELVD